jgi:hypothetical protein
MALDTYANLKASALAWIERTGDPAAETIIDDCVTLCEARLNKTPTLRLSHMETQAVLTLTDGQAALPADFLAMKRVVSGYGPGGGFDEGFDEGFDVGVPGVPVLVGIARLIRYAEPGWYDQAHPTGTVEPAASFYTIVGTTLHCRSSSTLGIVYYARIPPLATNDPNWLLEKAPDVYLFGTILELLNALEGDATGKYAGLFSSAVDSLIASETFSRGGVLTMRAHMPAP